MIDWNYVFTSDIRYYNLKGIKLILKIREIAKFYNLSFMYVYKIYKKWRTSNE